MSLASNCFDVPNDPPSNFDKLHNLSLDDKIIYSTAKIKEFWIAVKGKTYVSYSGGKDSTVLLHLVRSIYPDTPAVYVDTGLEFPEIRDMVKMTDNVEWLRPSMTFKNVIEEKGYPVISKTVAHWVDLAQRGQPSGLRQMQMDSRYGCKRYESLVSAPFRVSEKCCDIMKKHPAKEYHDRTGRCPYIGTRADESRIRTQAFMDNGENNLEKAIPSSTPLSIWTEQDVWDYIRRYNLPYSKAYDMGYDRTGCMFCMFGITIDRDRFLKLKATHPTQWAYCMRERERGGLGMRTVLDYIGIPSGCGQSNLDEYVKED